MINIDLNELKDKLKPIIGIVDLIEPIGNHKCLYCGAKAAQNIVKFNVERNRNK